MRKVTIQYQPFKWLKSYNRYHIGNFPSEWKETTPKQIIAIACLNKRSISDVHFLSAMTGLSLRKIKLLDDYQRFMLIELFDEFNSDKPYNEFIIQTLDCKSTILLSPKPLLKGMSFGQFIYVDTYFTNYQKSSDLSDLNKFIAAAYLSYGQRFAEHIVDINHKWVNNIDLLTKEAIVINYHLIRDWLTTVYPLIFSKSTEKETEEKKPKKKIKDNNTWIKIYDNIVGDDIVNHKKYSNLPLHTVFRFLTDKIKQNLKN